MRRTPTHSRRAWAAFGVVVLATGALAPAAVAVDAAAPGGAPGSWKIDHIGVGSDEPTDDGAAGPSDGELPATGVAGGAVAAVLAAVLLTIGAALRSRREQEA